MCILLQNTILYKVSNIFFQWQCNTFHCGLYMVSFHKTPKHHSTFGSRVIKALCNNIMFTNERNYWLLTYRANPSHNPVLTDSMFTVIHDFSQTHLKHVEYSTDTNSFRTTKNYQNNTHILTATTATTAEFRSTGQTITKLHLCTDFHRPLNSNSCYACPSMLQAPLTRWQQLPPERLRWHLWDRRSSFAARRSLSGMFVQ
jgi:hypothetical protein